jgi:hypothetical protein
MRKQHIGKVFIILLFSTAYMLGFSHYGSLAINNIIDPENKFEENTVIGSVNVSNKSKAEAIDLIKKQTEKWKKDSMIEFTYKETSTVFNSGSFIFNIEKTLGQAQSGKQNVMQVVLKKNAIEEFIPTLSSKLAIENIDKDKLTSDLLAGAAMLDGSPQVFQLEKYIDGSAEQNEVISKASISLEDREREIRLLIKALPEIEIPAKTQVSLVEAIKAVNITKKDKVSSGIFASALYEAIMPTNFNILERNISRELPEYAKLGYEARIDLEKQVDLIFSNPNDTAYTLSFSIEGSKLVATLKGHSFLYKYNLVIEEQTKFKPNTIKQYSALMKEHESKVSAEGKDGLLIRIVRKTIDENGEEILSEVLSDDFYNPVHRVVISGLKEPEVQTPAEETDDGEPETDPEESEEEQSDGEQDPTEDGEQNDDELIEEEDHLEDQDKQIDEDAEEGPDAPEKISK